MSSLHPTTSNITQHKMILTTIAQSASSPSAIFQSNSGYSHRDFVGKQRTVPRNCLRRDFVDVDFIFRHLTSTHHPQARSGCGVLLDTCSVPVYLKTRLDMHLLSRCFRKRISRAQASNFGKPFLCYQNHSTSIHFYLCAHNVHPLLIPGKDLIGGRYALFPPALPLSMIDLWITTP